MEINELTMAVLKAMQVGGVQFAHLYTDWDGWHVVAYYAASEMKAQADTARLDDALYKLDYGRYDLTTSPPQRIG